MTYARLHIYAATYHLHKGMTDRHLQTREYNTIGERTVVGIHVWLEYVVSYIGWYALSVVFYCHSEVILTIHIAHIYCSVVCVAGRQCHRLLQYSAYHTSVKV